MKSVLKEDIEKTAALDDGERNIVIAQMTILINALVSGRDDIDDLIIMLEKQLWYKRMWDMPIGRLRTDKKTVLSKKDQLIVYMLQFIDSLNRQDRINTDMTIILGEKFKEIYYWVMKDSFEQLFIEDSVIQIRNMVENFAFSLDKKEAKFNFDDFIQRIKQGMYKEKCFSYSIIPICRIAALIDGKTLEDSNKLNFIRKEMTESGVIDGDDVSLYDCMKDIGDMSRRNVGEVYLGLSLMNDTFGACLFSEMIEKYTMLPFAERTVNNINMTILSIFLKNKMLGDINDSTIFRCYFDSCYNNDYDGNFERFVSGQDINLHALFDSFIDSRKETAEVTAWFGKKYPSA